MKSSKLTANSYMLGIESRGYNLSFAGCGFLGLYHAGVCGCIQEFAPQLYVDKKVSGTSAGAIAATFLVCNIKISECVQYLMQAINNSRLYILGPFDPRFKITQLLREGLELYLPDNAHILCTGRLHISMTNQISKENYIASTYKNRNELIKAVLCSSYIPVFSGFIPLTFRGEWMIDGAFTRNTLKLDGETITVSPFSGDADICPKDDWGYGQLSIAGTSFLVNSENIQRIINIMWPKSSEELGKLTQLGYNDTLQFLTRKGFIKCQLHRYHTIFMKMKIRSSNKVIDENCKKCRKHLQIALNSSLSKNILACFKESKEISLPNYYLTRKLIRYFRILTHITTIPISLTIKIISRCLKLIKYIPSHFIGSLLNAVRILTSLDEIFRKVLSNALETNYQHSYLCDALKDFSKKKDLQIEIESKNINSSESDDSLNNEMKSYSAETYLPDLNIEEKEQLLKQIINLNEVVELVCAESADGIDILPEILSDTSGAKIQGEVKSVKADNPEYNSLQKSEIGTDYELFLDLEHQLSWSYPDLSNPRETEYYVLSQILKPNLSKNDY